MASMIFLYDHSKVIKAQYVVLFINDTQVIQADLGKLIFRSIGINTQILEKKVYRIKYFS